MVLSAMMISVMTMDKVIIITADRESLYYYALRAKVEHIWNQKQLGQNGTIYGRSPVDLDEEDVFNMIGVILSQEEFKGAVDHYRNFYAKKVGYFHIGQLEGYILIYIDSNSHLVQSGQGICHLIHELGKYNQIIRPETECYIYGRIYVKALNLEENDAVKFMDIGNTY